MRQQKRGGEYVSLGRIGARNERSGEGEDEVASTIVWVLLSTHHRKFGSICQSWTMHQLAVAKNP